MYVIAHTSCEVDSRMLLSMYSLLFTAQALRWAPYDLSSDSDFVEYPFLVLFLFHLVSCSGNSALGFHSIAPPQVCSLAMEKFRHVRAHTQRTDYSTFS